MERDRSSLRPQVILLGLAALLNDISSDMIYPLLPIFLTSMAGATPFIVGMIEGSAEALSAFLKLGAGIWSDRLTRRKPWIVGGYGLAAFSRLLIGTAGRWPSVFVARLVDRTGKGIRSAPRDAMIADVTPPEGRGRAFGFHRALDHTGAVIGPLGAALFLGILHYGMRTIFLIAIIPGVIGVVMLLVTLREEPRQITHGAARDTSPDPMGRSFWLSMISIGLFYASNSSDVFLILQAHSAGVATAMIPILWAAHHVVKALFSTWAGGLSDRRGRSTLLITGWLLYGAIYFVFPYARSVGFFFVLFVLYSIPFTLTEGTERAWISDHISPRSRGRAFGIYYLVVGLLTLSGTALFGWLYQEVSHGAAFQVGGGIAVAAALSVAFQPARPAAQVSQGSGTLVV